MPLIVIFGLITFVAVILSALAQDALFAFHMALIAVISGIAAIWRMRTIDYSKTAAIPLHPLPAGYQDDVIRAGLIATVFWGIAGFLVGVYIALELAYPELNLDLPWTTFGLLVALVVVTLVGLWAGSRVERVLGRKDPGVIVIDEVAGMLLSVIGLPRSIPVLVTAFVLFRVFDVWKPFPARESQALSGGMGVMVDDLIAGLYALILVMGARTLFGVPA